MKIKYKHFWRGFEADIPTFEAFFDDPIFSIFDEMEITSVFPPHYSALGSKIKSRIFGNVKTNKEVTGGNKLSKKIWYTGENRRPPLTNQFDATLSFDLDNYGGKNVYLPLFYLRLLFPNESSFGSLGLKFEPKQLLLKRESNWQHRSRFACAFANNAEPTRLRAFRALSSLGEVDVYGQLSGKPVKDKHSVAKDYKFMVCFENSIFPGYVTEKLLDAYLCGTIPIYWGDLGHNTILNPKAFINYRDFKSLEDMADHIKSTSISTFQKMSQEPLLLKSPDLNKIRMDLFNALIMSSELNSPASQKLTN